VTATIDVVQGSPEWHALRLGKVTASRIADVLTEPRSKADKEAGRLSQTAESYMLELLGEIVTGLPATDYQSVAMRWGSDMEPMARDAYQDHFGVEVEQVGFVCHPTIPHVGCSPDGFLNVPRMLPHKGMLEIKCPFGTKEHLRTALSQAVPDQYVAQVQGQLWICDRDWSEFVSYDPRVRDPGLQLVKVPVLRDEAFIAEMETKVRNFVRVLLESVQALRDNYSEEVFSE
jgi:putative phage-type endonuclease